MKLSKFIPVTYDIQVKFYSSGLNLKRIVKIALEAVDARSINMVNNSKCLITNLLVLLQYNICI